MISGPDIDNLPEISGEQMQYLLWLLVQAAHDSRPDACDLWKSPEVGLLNHAARRDMPAIIRDAKKGHR